MQKPVAPVPEAKKAVLPPPVAVQSVLPLIPAGAAIDIRLNQGFSSDEVEEGQTFAATVATPLVVNGKVVIAQGADATIRVVSVDRAGELTGKTVTQLALVQVTAGSKRHQVASGSKAIEGKEQAVEAGKRVGVGGAVGAGVGFPGRQAVPSWRSRCGDGRRGGRSGRRSHHEASTCDCEGGDGDQTPPVACGQSVIRTHRGHAWCACPPEFIAR